MAMVGVFNFFFFFGLNFIGKSKNVNSMPLGKLLSKKEKEKEKRSKIVIYSTLILACLKMNKFNT
jgi:hypothetical protein